MALPAKPLPLDKAELVVLLDQIRSGQCTLEQRPLVLVATMVLVEDDANVDFSWAALQEWVQLQPDDFSTVTDALPAADGTVGSLVPSLATVERCARFLKLHQIYPSGGGLEGSLAAALWDLIVHSHTRHKQQITQHYPAPPPLRAPAVSGTLRPPSGRKTPGDFYQTNSRIPTNSYTNRPSTARERRGSKKNPAPAQASVFLSPSPSSTRPGTSRSSKKKDRGATRRPPPSPFHRRTTYDPERFDLEQAGANADTVKQQTHNEKSRRMKDERRIKKLNHKMDQMSETLVTGVAPHRSTYDGFRHPKGQGNSLDRVCVVTALSPKRHERRNPEQIGSLRV